MAVDINSEDGLLIRKLVPLATMPISAFSALCAEMSIEETKDGYLFKKGDTDSSLVYLIKGEVILQAEGLVVETISASAESAKFALAHQIPRKIDAAAKGLVRFLRLDASAVNNHHPVDYKEESSFMIVDEPEDDTGDWMTALLKSPVFRSLPPANLQKIIMGLELIECPKGSIIIEQGAEGDFYFLLKSGQCLISRKPSASAKEIKLGLLEKGETFGEDSLISGAPRSVTITALTDVSLLRLDKKQFVSLIKEPSLKFIKYQDLEAAKERGAILFDIRTPDEYEKRHIEGSINVPYFSLRMQLKTLSRDKIVVVICADGKSSEAGAFLLLKNRFTAFILKDGMNSVPLKPEPGVAEFAIDDGSDISAESQESIFSKSTDIVNLNEQIQFLKAENESLRKLNQQLNDKCMKLEMERDEAEKQLKIVLQQQGKTTVAEVGNLKES